MVVAFDFTTTNGDRLDLVGSLTSHSDEIQTGAVEKRVVRRPRRSKWRRSWQRSRRWCNHLW